jgi:hypothetical protein
MKPGERIEIRMPRGFESAYHFKMVDAQVDGNKNHLRDFAGMARVSRLKNALGKSELRGQCCSSILAFCI